MFWGISMFLKWVSLPVITHRGLSSLTPKQISNWINRSCIQESSITEEVEAELRPPSSGSSHTPILPSKKVRHPRDDSLPSPRGVPDNRVPLPGSSHGPTPASAILSNRSTVVQLRRVQANKAGKQAPTPPKRTRWVISLVYHGWLSCQAHKLSFKQAICKKPCSSIVNLMSWHINR